jgi:mono/diheme cytochrome c family protein
MRRFVPVALPAAMIAATLAWFAAVQAREAGAPAAISAQAPATPVAAPVPPVPVRGAPLAAAPRRATAPAAAPFDAAAHTATVKQYCATCHSERGKAGGLSLASFDAGKILEQRELTEKIVRKLRAKMMPPSGAKRPEGTVLADMALAFETRIDAEADRMPTPGARSFLRLNRAEYQRAIKDLLALDIDVTALLPADTISHGFDNVADAQTFSPALMESYLRAASKVAALALGDRDAEASEAHYRVPKTASQLQRVEGAPFGTRGGLSVMHTFPADGEYVFRVDLHGNACGFLFGAPSTDEQIEISVDGERRALLSIDPKMYEGTTSLNIKSPPIHVPAGAHRVTAAFLQKFEGPVNDLIAPIDHTLADTQIGVAFGITTMPHLKDLAIAGPTRVTGISDTASRREVFTCRPTSTRNEQDCATEIVRKVATKAFRRPVSDVDFADLMRFYQMGRDERDFEGGIGAALEAILASPQFIFRLESAPATAKAGSPYKLRDIDLASRLSFFLWGSGPDETLAQLAAQGRLSTPGTLERQVRRMLADPRSEALAQRFAGQWLRLRDVEEILPDALLYPYFDRTLGRAMMRESELFFDSLVREDRSLLELITADYTFVNERLAKHYGLPNVTGTEFQRVTVPETRRGILGHGSVLVQTSVADRTSPVMRGKWVMEVLLGSPPPPPPPNIPALEETGAANNGRILTVRERMEEHRKNPACTSCHRVIDPLGLTLENFDVTGRWRIKDNGHPVDSTGVLYDGTPMEGPVGLRAALIKNKDPFLLSFTESLMTFALGRRIEATDLPAVRRVIRGAAAQDYRLSSFILGVVNSPAFQMNTAIAPESTATPAEAR